MRMAVRKKIVLLMSLFALVAVAGLGYLRYSQMKTLGVLYRQLEGEFDTVADAGSAGLKTLANDYSYWDDLVRFVNEKKTDHRWAQRTFAPVLREFKANSVWICRTDGSCVYAVNNVTPNSMQMLPLTREKVEKIFAKSRFCRFFITTPQGVMEVQGATIHPTADVKRTTVPQGYLFAGKFWDAAYVGSLASASGHTVSLARSPACGPGRAKNSVVFSRPLRGWNGRAVMYARVGVQSALVGDVAAALNGQFYSLIFAAIVFLVALYAALDRWVSAPLNQIYGALDSEDLSKINALMKDKSEFGYIAGLITKAFDQKSQLLAETLRLREALETHKQESGRLSSQIQGFTAELNALKEKYASDLENRRKSEEAFGSGDFNMLKLAYDDLDRKFQEQRTKLHVVSELLQREIIKSHEHYKAEMVAAYQREQALKELNRMTEEIEQHKIDEIKSDCLAKGMETVILPVADGETVAAVPNDSSEKRPGKRRKVLGANMPKITYTEAQC